MYSGFEKQNAKHCDQEGFGKDSSAVQKIRTRATVVKTWGTDNHSSLVKRKKQREGKYQRQVKESCY